MDLGSREKCTQKPWGRMARVGRREGRGWGQSLGTSVSRGSEGDFEKTVRGLDRA